MTYAVHFCRATGCQRQIPLRLLMCIDHWRQVPAPMQRAVYGTLRAHQRAPRDLALVRAYQKAVDDAVAAVATKQYHKLAARAAAGGDLFGPPSDKNESTTDGNHHTVRPGDRAARG